MDRKGIIGVAIAIIVLVLWQVDYSRKMQRYTEAQRAAEAAKKLAAEQQAAVDGTATAPATTPASTPGAAAPGTPAAVVPEVPPAEEKTEKLSSPSVQYTFTSRGGGIARVELLKHVAEYGKVEGDETKVVLNQLGPIPIGAITERAGEAAGAPFNIQSAQSGEVILERTDARQLQTVKKFTVPKSETLGADYTIGFEVTFSNKAAQPLEVPAYFVHSGAAAPIHKNDQPYYTGVSFLNDGKSTFKQLGSFTAGGFLGFGKQAEPTFAQSVPNVSWVGVTNQYFATIVRPLDAAGTAVWAHKFHIDNAHVIGAPGGKAPVDAVEAAIGMPGVTLAPGQSVTQKFTIYAGPREQRRLAALGGDQEKVMDFGMFAPISKGLLASMNWLHAKFGSYAAAIIVLTLIIKSLLWPLQNKATNSMKKMQALQPKMTELREKYQDDPQRMNMELMKLYKDYGVNPFGGCLPMLVQIPIFFGFYNMLGKAVELRNSQFLWVKDLSQPDTVAMLAGVPINILPLVMAGTMFWQMAISPKSGDPVQQRVFMFMPLIFVFFCYNFASALALYWTVQNIFSVVQLYLTRNKETPALQKVTGPDKKKRA
jgi:YidC/Oxa1 family membrane protein insertase